MTSEVKASQPDFFDSYRRFVTGDVDLSDCDKGELRWRRFSYFAFTFVVVAIGLPIWYVTTTPYRANLPYFGGRYREELKEFLTSQNVTNFDRDGDVWLQTILLPRYNVHLIFVHDIPSTNNNFDDAVQSAKVALSASHRASIDTVDEIIAGLRRFVQLFADSMEVAMTSEHLFDFSLAEFMEQQSSVRKQGRREIRSENDDRDETLTVTTREISALTVDIDRLSLPPLTSSDPLVKIVIFLPADNITIRFIDEYQKMTDGLAVASWGGFVSTSQTLNSIFAILRLELGIVASRARVSASPLAAQLIERRCQKQELACASPVEDAVYHRLLATTEHLSRCIHLIDSLHDLVAKLEDLVISEEVAGLANAAYEHFMVVHERLVRQRSDEFNATSSLRARLLAEAAITHPSLLEYLNFPSDQKFGIYIPLFFPISVPIIMPVMMFLLFAFKNVMSRRKSAS